MTQAPARTRPRLAEDSFPPQCPPLLKETNPPSWRSVIAPLTIAEGETDWKPDWVFRPILARGMISLIAGAPKAGKSTFISAIIAATAPVGLRTILLSEEPGFLWSRRLAGMGVPMHEGWVLRYQIPGHGASDMEQWIRMLDWTGQAVAELGNVGLVVIDTLAGVGPLNNENDASECSRVMRPLRGLADAGPAVAVVHHARKPSEGAGPGAVGVRMRGSSALAASVDVLAELDVFGKSPGERRRQIRSIGRLPAMNGERVFTVGDDGTIGDMGDPGEIRPDAIRPVILEAIRAAGDAGADHLAIAREIKGRRTGLLPSRATVDRVVSELTEEGTIRREGLGRRGDPFRFFHTEGVL